MSLPTRDHSEIDLDAPERVAAADRLVPSGVNSTLDRLCGLAARLLGTESAQISLLTDQQHVAGGVGLGAVAVATGPTPREHSLCTVTLASAAPLVVEDALREATVASLPPVASGAVRSYLGVPLTDAGGQLVGTLCVYGREARSWDGEQVAVLEELAAAAAAELERSASTLERDEAQFRLEVAIDAGGIGSWEWDRVTGVMSADERTMAMFGLPTGPASAALTELERRVHRDDAAKFGPAMRAAVEAGEDYSGELRIIGGDGRTRWVVARGRPLHDLSGQVVHLVGAMYETTEQHVAAESATASADLVSLLAAASDLLSGSLEPEDAVRSLTRIVVPRLADWSMVSLVGDDGVLRDVEWWHADPAQRPALDVFGRYRLLGRESPEGTLQALATGEPLVLMSGTRAYAERVLVAPEAIEALADLDIESSAVLPLIADGNVIGTISLVRGTARPAMTEAELATAIDLGRRASTTLTIARAYGLEREMSEGLQRSLLTEPVQPDHLEIVVRYVPASAAAQVGGDWYDAFMQPDGATILVVGDVVGHDTAAAAAMGQLRNLLRGVAVASGDSPAGVLEQVDRAMQTLRLDTTATAVVARVEQEPGEIEDRVTRVRWSNAGHPPAVVVDSDGTTRLLDDHDLLLGVVPETERRESVMTLERGSTVLLFSDGLVERRNEHLDDGVSRLRRVVADLRDEPLQELADQLLAQLAPVAPDDDIALVAVRLHPQDRPRPPEAGPVVVPPNVPDDPAEDR